MLGKNKSQNKLYRFAFAVVSVIILVSLLLSALVISVVNDMFAFMKKNVSLKIHISSPTSVKSISHELQKGGIINNPSVFTMYVKAKGEREALESFQGEIILRSDMGYRAIVNEFLKKIK
ncbi:MAG: endolytic transglycosylase MltG [Ruminococcaceae bacterium]|nr:endolytic transglycosylase MltG [Oscillospiraceae bacterium]